MNGSGQVTSMLVHFLYMLYICGLLDVGIIVVQRRLMLFIAHAR